MSDLYSRLQNERTFDRLAGIISWLIVWNFLLTILVVGLIIRLILM